MDPDQSGPSGPSLDDVAVVIPTLGRPILARALEALADGTRWPAKVLVVDQGSDDNTLGIVEGYRHRGFPVEHIRSGERGRAQGVNEGIRRAGTRFVLVTDDDCLAEPTWVEAMVGALEDHPEAIVTGRVEAWEGGGVPVVVTGREPFVQRKPRFTFDSLSGGNMGVARSVIERLGFLDEDPRSATAEDAELAYRALRHGVPLVYEPASGVAHMDWREGEARARQYRSYALSHGAFYGKYLRRGDPLIGARLVIHLLRAARRWASAVASGDADRALNGRSYLLHLPRGVVEGWRSPQGVVTPGPARPATTHAGNPQVAILILTLDQRESTLRALESLAPEVEDGITVVLWDNASRDGTAEAVRDRFPGALVHESQENLGVAGGRNAAARLAMERLGATHLLFLDNDMVVTPGFVRELLAPFGSDPLLAQTQAKLRFMDEPKVLNDGGGFKVTFWLGRTEPVGFREVDLGQRNEIRPCLPCGGATLVRADVFRELGGFDEIFNPFGPEDLDFSLRVRKAGYRALYVPRAMAFHAVTSTFEGGRYTELYARHKARNWLILLRRHGALHQRAAFYLLGMPYLVARMLAREGPRKGLAALRGWARGTTEAD